MLRLMTTTKIAKGKGVKAVEWASQWVEFLKKYKSIPPVHVYSSIIGESGLIIFFADYDDFAHYQKAVVEVRANNEYTQRIDDAADLFIEGSSANTMLNLIA